MRIGLATPTVTYNPGNNNEWELGATVDDLRRIAETADRLGFHHLTCSEHIGVPAGHEVVPGTARYWDPLATLSFLAAVTERIRLETHILVLPYHHPLAIAKRYGTLDALSKGRLVLGVGAGHSVREFELLGVPFEERNDRSDDAIRALRAALSQREPHYEGTYYRFGGLVVDPHAVQDHVPIWLGGRSRRSLRRAVELADGWVPFDRERDELDRMLRRARDEGLFEHRHEPFDVVLYVQPRVDPLDRPEETAEALAAYREIGATVVTLRMVHQSLEHCLEQLEAVQGIARDLDASR